MENDKKEIKKLIEMGFDLELLSFELDVPIEELKQYKKEIEQTAKASSTTTIKETERVAKVSSSQTIKRAEQVAIANSTKTINEKKVVSKKSELIHSEMEKMRQKYKKLFLAKDEKEKPKIPPKLTKKQLEAITTAISKIEENINSGEENKTENGKEEKDKEKNVKVRNISLELKKIKDEALTVEQAEKLYLLMQTQNFQKLKTSANATELYISKKKIVRKLAETIDIAQSQTEEVKELERLGRKLTLEMERMNPIFVSTIRGKIENKVLEVKQKEANYRTRNDIPTHIENIVQKIANGTLKIETANKIIEKEAKKRVKGRKQTRFALTEEQERKQILNQIKTILAEYPEKYHIKNPEDTIMQVQELSGCELEQAIRTVVDNFIIAKKFEKAKEICNTYSKQDSTIAFQKNIKLLRKKIKNAEVGDIVLAALNASQEDEQVYFETIEKYINNGNIKLNLVYLGKNQDGTKNIYLSDIWEEERKVK